MSYSGRTTIQLPIVRRATTGEEYEIELTIVGRSFYRPASGLNPPEGEIEIIRIMLDNKPTDIELTDEEWSVAEQKIDEAVREENRNNYDNFDPWN